MWLELFNAVRTFDRLFPQKEFPVEWERIMEVLFRLRGQGKLVSFHHIGIRVLEEEFEALVQAARDQDLPVWLGVNENPPRHRQAFVGPFKHIELQLFDDEALRDGIIHLAVKAGEVEGCVEAVTAAIPDAEAKIFPGGDLRALIRILGHRGLNMFMIHEFPEPVCDVHPEPPHMG